MAEDLAEGDGVQRLAILRMDVPQEIEKDQPAGGEGERDRHIGHGPAPRDRAGLAQHVDVVGDRLDAGIGAAAQREGLEHDADHRPPADLAGKRTRLVQRLGDEARQPAGMAHHADDDEPAMGDEEADENRQQQEEQLLDPAQIGDGQQDDDDDLTRHLPGLPLQRQKAEQRIDAAGHRKCRGQDEIDDEGRARDEPGIGADQHRGDAIAAAPGRKELDHLDIAQADDDDGQRGGERQIDGQMAVDAQRKEGFFRPVVRRGEAVGAQADPGQKGDQQHALALLAMHGVARRADDPALNLLPVEARHVFR